MAATCDPRVWRAEKPASQTASSVRFGFSERPCFSIEGGGKRKTLDDNLKLSHVYTNTCENMHPCTHTCPQTWEHTPIYAYMAHSYVSKIKNKQNQNQNHVTALQFSLFAGLEKSDSLAETPHQSFTLHHRWGKRLSRTTAPWGPIPWESQALMAQEFEALGLNGRRVENSSETPFPGYGSDHLFPAWCHYTSVWSLL